MLVLLDKVRGRLRDKSSLVRKAALQFLSTLLSKNPYSAKVSFIQRSLRVINLSNNCIIITLLECIVIIYI